MSVRHSHNTVSKVKEIAFDKIAKALIPSMKLVPSLSARIIADATALHRLTEEQAGILGFVQAQSRARIWGVAGSGKTILTVQQAQRFATSGKTTLLLCCNRSLASWLRNATADDDHSFEVMTFHELCELSPVKAGFMFSVPEDPSLANAFWKQHKPELLMDHYSASGLYWEALVVDEGQDFQENWWMYHI